MAPSFFPLTLPSSPDPPRERELNPRLPCPRLWGHPPALWPAEKSMRPTQYHSKKDPHVLQIGGRSSHLEPDFQEDGVREGTSQGHTHPSSHGGTSGPWYLGDPFLHPGFSLFHPFAHRFLVRQKLPLQVLKSGPLCKAMEQGPTPEQDRLLIRTQYPKPHHSQKPCIIPTVFLKTRKVNVKVAQSYPILCDPP